MFQPKKRSPWPILMQALFLLVFLYLIISASQQIRSGTFANFFAAFNPPATPTPETASVRILKEEPKPSVTGDEPSNSSTK